VAVQAQHIPWHRARPGDTLRIDGVLIRALAPDSTWTAAQTDPNLASVVVAVEYGQVRWLLTGDAEAAEEAWLVEHWGDALSASVLKAGHHGSKTSSSPAFLDRVNPSVALVSVGADNTYGHPSPSTLQEFAKRGIRTFRTDRDGSIVVRTNGLTEEVEAAGEKWNIPVRVKLQ
jgi:competence protein ComEC